MSTISTFELLIKRIGPPGGISFPNGNAPFRRLLQGYYLTIANPNNSDLILQMQTIFPKINTPNTSSPFSALQRELVAGDMMTRNHIYAYDRTGDSGAGSVPPREQLRSMIPWDSTNTSRTFRTSSFNLSPFQTGLINLIPNPAALGTNPQVEVRGYVKIVQVQRIVLVEVRPGIFLITFVVPPPVELLFTPEIRGTFLDDNFNPPSPPSAPYDFDQSNYSLPTSTGSAQINITESVNPFLRPIRPIELGRRIELKDVIDFKKVHGSLNYIGEFCLGDESLKEIDKSIKRLKVDISTKLIKDEIETTINKFGFNVKKKRRIKKTKK